MRSGGRILILLAIVLLVIVILAALFLPQLLSNFTLPGQPSTNVDQTVTPEVVINTIDVVVLAQPVSRGTRIDETVLTTVVIDQTLRLEGMFTDLGEVVGRVARYDLDPGMILTRAVLLDLDETLQLGGSDWALAIEPGKVAISVPISRLSSVSYAPRPGDSVDIIASLLMIDIDPQFQTQLPNRVGGVVSPGTGVVLGTGEGNEATADVNENLDRLTVQIAPGGASGLFGRTEIDPVLGVPFYVLPGELEQRPRLVSQSILQDVTILRVGTFPLQEEEEQAALPQPTAVPAEGQSPEGEEAATTAPTIKMPDVITVIVNLQDAIALNYLIHSGAELTFVLRSANDATIIPTEAVTLQFLLDQYNIPVPAKLPYGLEPGIQIETREALQPELPNDQPDPTPQP